MHQIYIFNQYYSYLHFSIVEYINYYLNFSLIHKFNMILKEDNLLIKIILQFITS